MASVISASTTSATALNMSADTTGVLQLATGATPTTAVTIDTSQNVGIGTASPTTKLNVVSTNAGNNSIGLLLTNLSNTSGTGATIGFSPYNDNTTLTGSISNYNEGSALYSMRFNTWNGTSNTERMRIDSSGKLLIGKTSTAVNVAGFQVTVENGAASCLISKTLSGGVNAWLNYHNGTYVGGINFDNTSTAFPTSSDIRLKKDIVDAPSATQKIDNIRIVSHGWKHDDAVVDFGIIAQELYDVMPRAVTKGDDGEEIETTWGVDYSKLVPMLIKAHQEQQTIINDLKARIETLEGAKL